MEPDQAAEMLTVMRGYWPRFARDDVTTTLWLGQLVKCRADIAGTALAQLTSELDEPPSVAQWQEACRSAWRGVRPARELDAWTPVVKLTGDEKAARFSAMRHALDSTPTRYADQSKHPEEAA